MSAPTSVPLLTLVTLCTVQLLSKTQLPPYRQPVPMLPHPPHLLHLPFPRPTLPITIAQLSRASEPLEITFLINSFPPPLLLPLLKKGKKSVSLTFKFLP